MRSDRVQSLAGFFRLQDRSYHATGYKAQKVRVTGYQQQRQSGAHGAAIPSFRKPSYPSYRSQDAVQRQNVPTNPAAVTGGQFRLLSNTGPFGIGPGLPADIVPDTGSTAILLGLGFFGIILVTHCLDRNVRRHY